MKDRHPSTTWSPMMIVLLLALVMCCTESDDDDGNTGNNPPPANETPLFYDQLPQTGNDQLQAFHLDNRWQKSNLTYFFINFSGDLDAGTQREIFKEAFAAWEEVTPLTFQEVSSAGNADLLIGFGNGTHCNLYQANNAPCPNDPFEGFGGVLAHAYFPRAGPYAGDAHFDEGETWSAAVSGTSLLSVAIHELGHSLGLEHSNVRNAIMFASYEPNDIKIDLRRDDIERIQQLYGSGDGNAPRPVPPPPEETPNVNACGTPTANDSDGDGLTDVDELYLVGTDPNNCDTDGDGLPDSEVFWRLNPLNPDTDGDGASDGNEVAAGSNPYIPDQGGNGGGLVGYYVGFDSFGSPLEFNIFQNGSVQGALQIIYFGVPTVITLYGGVDGAGNILMSSADYFFSYFGVVGNGFAQGQFQTAAGAFGTWSTRRTKNKRQPDQSSLVDSSRYQPVPDQRNAPTHPVHYRVDWRGHHH